MKNLARRVRKIEQRLGPAPDRAAVAGAVAFLAQLLGVTEAELAAVEPRQLRDTVWAELVVRPCQRAMDRGECHSPEQWYLAAENRELRERLDEFAHEDGPSLLRLFLWANTRHECRRPLCGVDAYPQGDRRMFPPEEK